MCLPICSHILVLQVGAEGEKGWFLFRSHNHKRRRKPRATAIPQAFRTTSTISFIHLHSFTLGCPYQSLPTLARSRRHKDAPSFVTAIKRHQRLITATMRFHQLIAPCVAILAINIANCLSIYGLERNFPHALEHVGKNVAANIEALLTVNKRDVAPTPFTIDIINNINSSNVRAYIQTTHGGTNERVLITSEGQVYKPIAFSNNVATPIPKSAKCGIALGPVGSTTTVTMPIALMTGRIYVADGELDIGTLQVGSATEIQHPAFANPHDPNYNTNFGFVEINQPNSRVWVNPTYVDFVGLPIAMEMVFNDYVLNVSGLPVDGVKQVCDLLKVEEDKDGYPWSTLCLKDDKGEPIRVLSPEHRPSGFARYFDDYINQVWSRFGGDSITFDLQSNEPLVSCRMNGDSMVCDSAKLPFSKPATSDIWGCNSGPFANTGEACHDHTGSRLCAAFHRATLLLPGGAIQPNLSVNKYYPGDTPHNKYARIVHEVQVDHMGYTFPYDDVKPDFNSEVSGTISGDNPKVLRIYAGGRDTQGGQHSSASSASTSTMSTETVQGPSATDATPECVDDTVCAPDEVSVTTTTIGVTVQVPSPTDTIPECVEESICAPDDVVVTTTTIGVTVAVQESAPSETGDSSLADSSLNSVDLPDV